MQKVKDTFRQCTRITHPQTARPHLLTSASLRTTPEFPEVITIRSTQFPYEEDTDGSRNVVLFAVLPSHAPAGPRKYYWPTPQHISLGGQDIIIHRNRDIHRYVNEGTLYVSITLPSPNGAHFIFTGWHRHKYLLTCTLKVMNQFCAQTKQDKVTVERVCALLLRAHVHCQL